jgi:hypothetical protein
MLSRSYTSTGAHSGGLQQQRDMFNWSNSYLYMDPQTQLGTPSSGLQQQRDMFNWSNSPLQICPQTQVNPSSGRIMTGTQQELIV